MRHNKRLSNTLLLLLLYTLSGCFPQQVKAEQIPAMRWIEDKSGTMTLDEILDQNLFTQWNKTQQHTLNFGFTDSVIWLSLRFENPNETQTSMLLEIAFPLHDRIDFYLLDDKKVVSTSQTGDHLPFSERPLSHRNFLFPYILAPKEKLQAIVRVQSTDTMYIPAKVWESHQFFTKDQHEVLFLGVFFGFLSIMLIYNLFLYCSTRHKNYLYYTASTASIIYLQLTQKSFGYQYLWPNEPYFNHMSVPISSYVMLATGSFFILKFLDLNKKNHAKIISTFQIFIGIALLGTAWGIIVLNTHSPIIPYYSTVVLATAIIAIISTVVGLGILINLSIKGSHSARILSIAWLFLLTGSLVFALGRIGVPIPMLISENAMLIGSTLEAILISFTLATHIKKERRARMIAQNLALRNERETRKVQNSLLLLQEKTTQQLEQEVKERTQSLETAMNELTLANEKLDDLSRIDCLTGLSNRRDFDQKFEHLWLSYARQKKPISLLMVDIDHFKSINDTYGHLIGDQCLVHIATIFKSCTRRTEDLAARFGGEEFTILLADTNATAAKFIAEQIRLNIEKSCLTTSEHYIKFTVSIGTITVTPTPGSHCMDILASADEALYLAKEGGRNRVIAFNSSDQEPAGAPLTMVADGMQ